VQLLSTEHQLAEAHVKAVAKLQQRLERGVALAADEGADLLSSRPESAATVSKVMWASSAINNSIA
jgi:hypothetical protein